MLFPVFNTQTVKQTIGDEKKNVSQNQICDA